MSKKAHQIRPKVSQGLQGYFDKGYSLAIAVADV